jgi:hypothetical protein
MLKKVIRLYSLSILELGSLALPCTQLFFQMADYDNLFGGPAVAPPSTKNTKTQLIPQTTTTTTVRRVLTKTSNQIKANPNGIVGQVTKKTKRGQPVIPGTFPFSLLSVCIAM